MNKIPAANTQLTQPASRLQNRMYRAELGRTPAGSPILTILPTNPKGPSAHHRHVAAFIYEVTSEMERRSEELGAGWVPELLRRLDVVTKTYARVDTNLAAFTRTPSEQLTTQMGFTPFVFEDVARLVDESNPDLYLFSSDYPHTEGGRDPIARFESSLTASSPLVKDKFYAENFRRLFPSVA